MHLKRGCGLSLVPPALVLLEKNEATRRRIVDKHTTVECPSRATATTTRTPEWRARRTTGGSSGGRSFALATMEVRARSSARTLSLVFFDARRRDRDDGATAVSRVAPDLSRGSTDAAAMDCPSAPPHVARLAQPTPIQSRACCRRWRASTSTSTPPAHRPPLLKGCWTRMVFCRDAKRELGLSVRFKHL